ncbi:MAG: hypothetical protein AVDCRST_MAG65-2317 [uncultured Solirubrobacteraceae bacterium]|uniref:Thioredoxin domain-containing protein n=1 Tax=uncultured Solirubrobacteraceae bacterium TaxID=1162706 RepID=A0A6J4SDS3_9ACTN|nr:MAG: hypothetical protein AVDCRST_MAG65-2317 [uncultured Solirubrobacteraceae bacterium]
MTRLTVLLAGALSALLLLAGCGSDGAARDPIEQVPETGGLREQVADAREVKKSDFPAPAGRSLIEMAQATGARDGEAALASSVFTAGSVNRLAFGSIDEQGQFAFGRTAVYVARRPGAPAQGPYPAPADLLVTDPAFRSAQAATEEDPFAAVYAARVPFKAPGRHAILTVTRAGDRMVAATGEVQVTTRERDPIPDVGEKAPRVETDTLASAGGDVKAIDTREPPSDMHQRSFADVVGKKPVALLFATPQLCQSRVCGPVVDVALQLEKSYGDRVEFIHQEVYRDNDPNLGIREPLARFNLRTEPWLFVVDADGRITARLEGSFGLDAFERALKTAL